MRDELKGSGERWCVHDEHASRQVNIDWLRAQRSAGDAWPGFINLFVDAPMGASLTAFEHARGARWEVPDGSPDEVVFASTRGSLSLIASPMHDPDEPPLDPGDADALFEALGADGVYVTHDPDAGALTFARYRGGVLRFLWADTIVPPHSTALTFHEDGRCTEEDGRRWALRALDLPRTGELDRYALITYLARVCGVTSLCHTPDARDARRALHMA